MDKTWIVFRTLARQLFGISLRSKKGRRALFIGLLLLIVLIPQGFVLYSQYSLMYAQYSLISAAGTPAAPLSAGLTLASMFCALMLLFTFPAELYFSSDLKTLLALPVPARAIILAKTGIILLYQIPFILLISLPLALAAALSGTMSSLQIALTVVQCILVPLTTVILLGCLTILAMQFLPFVRNKDRYNLVVGFLSLILAVLIGLVSGSSGGNMDFSGFSAGFFQIAPAIDSILHPGLLRAVISLLIPAAVISLYMFLADHFYLKAALAAGSASPKKIRTAKSGGRTLFDSLYLTDLKRLYRTPAYATNNILGAFIFPVMMTGMVLLVPDLRDLREVTISFDLEGWLRTSGYSSGCIGLAAGVISALFFADMNSICATAISREGESGLKWMKSVPVTVSLQLNAKLLNGWIFSMLTIIFMLVPVLLMVHLSLLTILSYLAGAAIASLVVNQIVLMADIRFPKLNWTSEAAAVKNNYLIAAEVLGFYLICALCIGIVYLLGKTPLMLNLTCSALGIIFVFAALALWKQPARLFEKYR